MNSLIVEGISKRYLIPKAQKTQRTETRFDRLRDLLSIPLARELMGAQELWALKDMSFEVEAGTVLGVIGSNGAGKTTLLKVISKVIAPSSGRISGRGMLMAQFGEGDDGLLIAVAHLSLGAGSRASQLSFIAELLHDHQHAVLMGDFNCSIDRPEMQALFKR